MKNKFKRVMAALLAIIILLGNYSFSTTEVYAFDPNNDTVNINNVAEAVKVLGKKTIEAEYQYLDVQVASEEALNGSPVLSSIGYTLSVYKYKNVYLVMEIPTTVDLDAAVSSAREIAIELGISLNVVGNTIVFQLVDNNSEKIPGAGTISGIPLLFPAETTEAGTLADLKVYLYSDVYDENGGILGYTLISETKSVKSQFDSGIIASKNAVGLPTIVRHDDSKDYYMVEYKIDVTRNVTVGGSGSLAIGSMKITDVLPSDSKGNAPVYYEYSHAGITSGGAQFVSGLSNNTLEITIEGSSYFTDTANATVGNTYKLLEPVIVKVYYEMTGFAVGTGSMVNKADVIATFKGGVTGEASGTAQVDFPVGDFKTSAKVTKETSGVLNLNALLDANQKIEYTIKVTNTGDLTIDYYTVKDLLSSITGLSYKITGVKVIGFDKYTAKSVTVNNDKITYDSGVKAVPVSGDVTAIIEGLGAAKAVEFVVTVEFDKIDKIVSSGYDLRTVTGIENTAKGYISDANGSKTGETEETCSATATVTYKGPTAGISKEKVSNAAVGEADYSINQFLEGQEIQYKITFSNTGETAIDQATITDKGLVFDSGAAPSVEIKSVTLASSLSNSVANQSYTTAGTNGDFVLTLNNVAVGEKVEITVTYNVKASSRSCDFTSITNTAELTSFEFAGISDLGHKATATGKFSISNEVSASISKYVWTGDSAAVTVLDITTGKIASGWGTESKIKLYDKLYSSGDTIYYLVEINNIGDKSFKGWRFSESATNLGFDSTTDPSYSFKVDGVYLKEFFLASGCIVNGDGTSSISVEYTSDVATDEVFYVLYRVELGAYKNGSDKTKYTKITNNAKLDYNEDSTDYTSKDNKSNEVTTMVDEGTVDASITKDNVTNAHGYKGADLLKLKELSYKINATLYTDTILDWYAIYDEGLKITDSNGTDLNASPDYGKYAYIDSVVISKELIDQIASLGVGAIYLDYQVGGDKVWYRVGGGSVADTDIKTGSGTNLASGISYTLYNIDVAEGELSSVRLVLAGINSSNITDTVTFKSVTVNIRVKGEELYAYIKDKNDKKAAGAADVSVSIKNGAYLNWQIAGSGGAGGSGGKTPTVEGSAVTLGQGILDVAGNKKVSTNATKDFNNLFGYGDLKFVIVGNTVEASKGIASKLVIKDTGLTQTGESSTFSLDYSFTSFSAELSGSKNYSDNYDVVLQYGEGKEIVGTILPDEASATGTTARVLFDITLSVSKITDFSIVITPKAQQSSSGATGGLGHIPSGLTATVSATATVAKWDPAKYLVETITNTAKVTATEFDGTATVTKDNLNDSYNISYPKEVTLTKKTLTTSLDLSKLLSKDGADVDYTITSTVTKSDAAGTLIIRDTGITALSSGSAMGSTKSTFKSITVTAPVNATVAVYTDATGGTSVSETGGIYDLRGSSSFRVVVYGAEKDAKVEISVKANVKLEYASKTDSQAGILATTVIEKLRNTATAEYYYESDKGNPYKTKDVTADITVANDNVPVGFGITKKADSDDQNIVQLLKDNSIVLEYTISDIGATKNSLYEYELMDNGLEFKYPNDGPGTTYTSKSNPEYLKLTKVVLSEYTVGTAENLKITTYNGSGNKVDEKSWSGAGTTIEISGGFAYFKVTADKVASDFDGTIKVTGALAMNALSEIFKIKGIGDVYEINNKDISKVSNSVTATYYNGLDGSGNKITDAITAKDDIRLFVSDIAAMKLKKTSQTKGIGAPIFVYGDKGQRELTFTISGINNNSYDAAVDELTLTDKDMYIVTSTGTKVKNYNITNVTVTRKDNLGSTKNLKHGSATVTLRHEDGSDGHVEYFDSTLVNQNDYVSVDNIRDRINGFELKLTKMPAGMELEVQVTIVLDQMIDGDVSDYVKFVNEANLVYSSRDEKIKRDAKLEIPIKPSEQNVKVTKTVKKGGTFGKSGSFWQSDEVVWNVVVYNNTTDEDANGKSVYIDPIVTDAFPTDFFSAWLSDTINETNYKKHIAIQYGTVDLSGTFREGNTISLAAADDNVSFEKDGSKIALKFKGELNYLQAISITYTTKVDADAEPLTKDNLVEVSSGYVGKMINAKTATDKAGISITGVTRLIVKMEAHGDLDAAGEYTRSSNFSRATTGSRGEYRFTVANYQKSRIKELQLLNILPYDGDTLIKNDEHSRGSSLRMALNGIGTIYYYSNEYADDTTKWMEMDDSHYTIYVTTASDAEYHSEIYESVKNRNVGAPENTANVTWTELGGYSSNVGGDLSEITAFYIAFAEDFVFEPNCKIQFSSNVEVPEASSADWESAYTFGDSIAWNVFAINYSDSVKGAALESARAGISSAIAGIGDHVWYDDNGNGIQDVNEAGAAGVEVYLFKVGENDDLSFVKRETTDSNGNYKFDQLPLGKYKVGFADKDSYTFTKANIGSDAYADSDAKESATVIINNRSVKVKLTDTIDLSDGSKTQEGTPGVDPSWDAGLIQKANPSLTITKNVLSASGNVIDVSDWSDSYSFMVRVTSDNYDTTVTLTKYEPSVTLRNLAFATYTIKETNSGGLSFDSLTNENATTSDEGEGINVALTAYEQKETVVVSNRIKTSTEPVNSSEAEGSGKPAGSSAPAGASKPAGSSAPPASSKPATSSKPAASSEPADFSEPSASGDPLQAGTVDNERITLVNGYTAVRTGDNEYMILDEKDLALGTIIVPEGMNITEVDLSDLIPFGNVDFISIDNPKTGDHILGKAVMLLAAGSALALLLAKRRKAA